jgi:hypothetical protein
MKGCNAHLNIMFLMYCWNLKKLFRTLDSRQLISMEDAEGKDSEEEEEGGEEEGAEAEEEEEGEEKEEEEEEEEEE